MIKKRFYFDVGDTDNGRISLVRGFFFGFLKDLELQGHGGIIDCPTLNKTHSCPMAAYKDTYKTVDLGDGGSFEDYDMAFTDPDNIEGKEAFIEFLVDHKGEATYTRMIELCNELIKLDEV